MELKPENTFGAEDEQLRLYLLGLLPVAEQHQVETWLLAESARLDQLLLVEEELIDSYVCEDLPLAERAQFESYFLAAPEQREKLRLAQSLHRYAKKAAVVVPVADPAVAASAAAAAPRQPVASTKGWRWPFPFVWSLPVAALVLLGLGVAAWWMFFRPAQTETALTALNQAYQAGRRHEVRVTGFAYAPWEQNRDANAPDTGYEAREHAELLVRSLAQRERNAATLHLLGRLYLARQEYDKAIEQFRAASAAAPGNARIESDLGAALYEKANALTEAAGTGAQFAAAGESLEYLNRALERDPASLEALFNRALCFELLKNIPRAREDWESYLKKDATSPWATEARRHLAKLSQQSQAATPAAGNLRAAFEKALQAEDETAAWELFSRARTVNSNPLAELLIDDFLARSAASETLLAQAALQTLRKAGELETRFTGDHLTEGLARYYAASTPAQRALTAQARELLKQGHARRVSSMSESLQLYQQAEALFRQAGDQPEIAIAQLQRGKNFIWANRVAEALDLLQKLDQLGAARQWLWLREQSQTQLSHAHFARNEFSPALESSQQAFQFAQTLQDRAVAADNLINIADLHRFFGDSQTSLGQLEQFAALIEGEPLSSQMAWRVCQEMSFDLAALGWYAAALDYQREALRLALELRVPVITARTQTFLGRFYGELGKTEEGVRSIQEALAIGRKNPQDAVSQNIVAHGAYWLGHLYRQAGQFEQALRCYDEQLALAQQMNTPFYSYGAHEGKFLAHLAQQQTAAAQAELQTTLELLERYRKEIRQEDVKNSFSNEQQEIYEAAIRFAAEAQGNPRLAFDYAEISRARALLDLTAGPVARSQTWTQIHARLAGEVQLVEYAVLKDALLIWVMAADDPSGAVRHIRQPISSRSLADKVSQYLQHLSRKPSPTETASTREAAELYDLLIGPIRPWLRADRVVCIVPDQSLCYLPFGALFSTARNQYLLEELALSIAPSASFLVAATSSFRQTSESGAIPETLLSVGASTAKHARFPGLMPLREAAEEAEAVARFYPRARLLTGANATEATVKAGLAQAEVIHLAAHSVLDAATSSNAAILLAPEGAAGTTAVASKDGLLHGYELQGIQVPRARLVVLSSCQSGVESFRRAEGMIGLARPFLIAGVPLVVSSLWRVDSDATRELMTRFHLHRKQTGLPTVQALRQAQRELLRDGKLGYQHPFYWAAFSVIGGHAKA